MLLNFRVCKDALEGIKERMYGNTAAIMSTEGEMMVYRRLRIRSHTL
jgi:hypothetical protein